MKQLLFAIFALYGALIVNGQCIDIPALPSLSQCTRTSALITPSSLPSFFETKTMMIYGTARIRDLCAQTTAKILSIEVRVGLSFTKILEVSWQSTSNAYSMTIKYNSLSSMTIVSVPMSTNYSPIDEWIEFSAILNLDQKKFMGMMAGATFKQVPSLVTYSSPTTLKFDTYTKFSLCTDDSGSPISCELGSLIIKYDNVGWLPQSLFIGGLLASVHAHYPFNEKRGLTLSSTPGNIGAGYLGSSTASSPDSDLSHLPVWSGGKPGLSFMSGTEYITMPNFIPLSSNPLTPHSVSISFWFKQASLIPSDAYMFRISSADLAFDKFACKMSSSSLFKNIVGNTEAVSSMYTGTPIWTLITVSLALRSDYLSFHANIYINSNGNLYDGSLTAPLTFLSSDVFRIGGPPSFIGQIANFKIISPSSNAVFLPASMPMPTCYPSEAKSIIGLPNTILEPICHSSCGQCFGTQSDNCLTCTGTNLLYNSKCISPCPPKTYVSLAESACIDCPDECESCTDSMTCQACISGYNLYNSRCILCDSTCDTCFNSQPNGCLTCQPGLTLQDSSCLLVCPLGCEQCTDSTTCTSCLSGYVLQNSVCEPCDSTCVTCFSPQQHHCLTCQPGLELHGSKCVAPPTFIASLKSTVVNVAKYTLLTASFCFGGSSQAIFMAIVARMIEYIKYLDIAYSEELETLLKNSDSKDLLTIPFGIKQPETIDNDKIVYKRLPHVFAENGLNPSFLHNFWDKLFFIAIVLAILISLLALEKIVFRSSKKRIYSLLKNIRIRTQNVVLVLIYDAYGDIIFLAVLEFRSVLFDPNVSIASFSICCFFLILGSIVFGYHLRLIMAYQKQKKKEANPKKFEEFSKQNQGVKVLVQDFKDQSIDQQAYLLIYVFRSILFSLVLSTLFDYPRVETCLITAFSLGMLLYLVVRRPMFTLNFAQVISTELMLLVVNCCVLTMSFLDDYENREIEARIVSSKIIIYISTIFYFIPLVFLITDFAVRLIKDYKQRRLKRSVSVLRPTPPALAKEPRTNESSNISLASDRVMLKSLEIAPRNNFKGKREIKLDVSQDFSQDISLNNNNISMKQIL